MSLTSQLKSKGSPIREIFDARLGNLQPVAEDMRRRVQRPKTIEPTGPYTPYEHRLIGTAFDYRARMYFKKFPLKQTMAYQGAQISDLFGTGLMAHLFKHWISPNYSYYLKRMGAKGSRPKPSIEKGLIETCIVLARFDEIARAPSHALPAYEGEKIRGVKDIADMTRSEYVEDLNRLSALFFRKFRDRLAKRSVLNPTFSGSLDVGGADADIILGRDLIDLKCTINAQLPLDKLRHSVYQVIGYALLDYDNNYQIENVGIYYARQGVHWSMPIPDLLHILSRGQVQSIEGFRSEFRSALRAH
jgi:hypothetical protein